MITLNLEHQVGDMFRTYQPDSIFLPEHLQTEHQLKNH